MRLTGNVRHAVTFAAASAIAAVVACAVLATPASAHSQLLTTNPADGAALTAPISEVDLTFNERVQGTFTTVVVRGPGDVSYSDGHVQVIDDVVHQRVYPLRSGSYEVAWRAISADGHPVEGQFAFTIALSAGEEPTAGPPHAASPATSGGGHTLAWVGGGIGGLVVIGVVIALMTKQRRHAPDHPDESAKS
jgi:methionine-rich copper-binding protein CopC